MASREEVIEQLKTRLKEVVPMSRVPPKSLIRFKDLASEEFEGDYGMTFKFLIDFYYGVIIPGTEPLEIVINNHEERLQTIEKQEEPENTSEGRVSLSGKRIGGNRK